MSVAKSFESNNYGFNYFLRPRVEKYYSVQNLFQNLRRIILDDRD